MITVYGFIAEPSEELRRDAADADLVVGGRRHLDALGVEEDKRVVLGRIAPAIDEMKKDLNRKIVVVASGDPLFYGVVRRIRAAGLKVRVVPVVTSLQMAFAAVGLPWDDALLVSAHGNDPVPAFDACRRHPKVGILTDPKNTLPQIVEATAGLGKTYVLAEKLGSADEQIRVMNEAEARMITDITSPNVVLVLDHHPDEPEALGEQHPIVGGFDAVPQI